MIVAVFLVSNTIGAIPIFIAMIAQSGTHPDAFAQLSANPNDFSVLGLDPNLFLVLMIFPFIAALAAFVMLIKPLNKRSFINVVNGTGNIRWKRFFISAAVWLVLSILYLVFYLKIDPSNFTLNNTTASIILLSVISITLIPFQATFEEVLFRGYLMQGFATIVRSRWFPLIMTSVMFGLMHSLNPEVKEFGFLTMMPQYIVFGLIFGIITILDDGIEAAMGAHSANNVFMCIMVTNKASALQTPALYEQQNIYPWTEFAGLIIIGIIFIFILSRLLSMKKFSTIFESVEVVVDQSTIADDV